MWTKLRPELVRRKREGIPVETCVQRRQNTVRKVGEDFVVLRSDGERSVDRTITANDIEHGELAVLKKPGFKKSIVLALRCLANTL